MEDKVYELVEMNIELESNVVILKSKLEHATNMLNTLLSQQKTVKKRKNVKMQYYRDHKNDDDIIEQVQVFKDTFPGMKVPWTFVKSLTDKKLSKT
jgi:aspartokinase